MMRIVLISLAAAASALVVATPASAQHYPQPQGYAWGWHNSGQARALRARIDNIQRQIEHLDRRNILSEREARRLRDDSRQLERRLRAVRQNGLHPNERYDIERRLARLEQRLWRDARDRDGRWGNNTQYAYDRDRDGRDDRYEDDRGSDHDGRGRGRDDD
jgi:septal ring factor EnvC (AmiA/AmiB activator)